VGASVVEQRAGGVHAAFLVAASLSMLAIVGAFVIRSSEPTGAPAGH
jgi:DHA2 family lincomycin resistance protein-like MFS transporter